MWIGIYYSPPDPFILPTFFLSSSNSMMTSVLRDSLGGNCKTVMIATLSGQRGHIDESISTCRFAARVAMVRNMAMINEEIDPKLVIKRLRTEVRELREELHAAQGKTGLDRPLDEDERARCRQIVAAFLASETGEVETGLPNRHKVAACFGIFKEMILAAQQGRTIEGEGESGAMQIVASNATNGSSQSKSSTSSSSSSGPPNAAQEQEIKKLRLMVSSRDNEISILIGLLKQHVRHGNDIAILEDVRQRALKQAVSETGITDVNVTSESSAIQQQLLLSKGVQKLEQIHRHTDMSVIGQSQEADSQALQERMAAFEEFRRSYRKNELIEEQKDSLKRKIEEAQRLGESINACRNEINQTKVAIESHRVQRGLAQLTSDASSSPNANDATMTEPDEHEEEMRSKIETAKLSYRQHFNSLKELKNEIEQLKHLIDRSRRKLQQDFDTWWTQQQGQHQQHPPSSSRHQSQPSTQVKPSPLSPPSSTSSSSYPSTSASTPTPRTNLIASAASVAHSMSAQSPSASPSSAVAHSYPSYPSSSQHPPHQRAGAGYNSNGFTSSTASAAPSNSSSYRSSPVATPSSIPPSSTVSSSSSSSSSMSHIRSNFPSTGNLQADADIRKFYEMRDSLIKQQMEAKGNK